MMNRIARRLAVAALALASLLAGSARGADGEKGVWWESTVQMQMKGMSMPPTVTKTCLAPGAPRDPPRSANDNDCTYSDVKHDGPKTSWKVVCTGKHAMTGEGEMTGNKDSYSGKMTMHMAQGGAGEMVMVMSGKLVGGECDASAGRKQADPVKKQAN